MRELISVKAKGFMHLWMSWGGSVITETTVDEASIFVSLRSLVADRTVIPCYWSLVVCSCKVNYGKHSSYSETLNELQPYSDSFNHGCALCISESFGSILIPTINTVFFFCENGTLITLFIRAHRWSPS
jgi:hypothetical protein